MLYLLDACHDVIDANHLVNAQESRAGQCALYLASLDGYLSMVRGLIEHGADVNLVDNVCVLSGG